MRLPFRLTVQATIVGTTLLSGCDVTYEIGGRGDASGQQQPDSATPTTLTIDAGASIPTAQLTPWSCERWGKGTPLTNAELALQAASHLWGGTQRDADDVSRTYKPVVANGRSGDFYCAVLHMLQDARATAGVGQFYASWLSLGGYPAKDPQLFPGYTAERLELMGRDARDFAVRVTLGSENNFARLFVTPDELNQRPAPTSELTAADVRMSNGGIVSMPGVLATVGSGQVSPTSRGAWFASTFLCTDVPPPPPEAPLTLPPPKGVDQSFRQNYEAAIGARPTCVDCHAQIDPIGYALDVFNAVGQLQARDRTGRPFVTAGSTTLVNGETTNFSGLAELARQLSQSQKAKRCYTQRWLEFLPRFTGIAPKPDSSPDELIRHLDANKGQIKFLIAAIFESAYR